MGIVVLGASGQLARHLQQQLSDAVFWGRNTQDIADVAALEAALVRARPQAIVNAAAYTAVDAAENNTATAWRLNAEAPAAMARAAASIDATLLQVSTDYVFEGSANEPYPVNAPVNPRSVYGASKLAGELAVRALCPRCWVLRTSWVFSEYGTNFVKTVLRLAASRAPLRIVADQFSRPTYAGDIASLIAEIDVSAEAPRLDFGVYHAAGGPIVNWRDFAEMIVAKAYSLNLLARPVPVEAITTAEFGAAARRPAYSALAPSPELYDLCASRFEWTHSLDKVLRALQAMRNQVSES